MKNWFFLFFFSISVLACSANNYNAELNRIEFKLKSGTLTTSEKIDLILLKANMAIYKGDYIIALKWINEAKNIGSNNPNDLMLVKDTEGEYYYKLSDIDKAERLWNEMYNIYTTSNITDTSMQALYFSRKGKIANYKIETNKALKFTNEAVRLTEVSKNSKIRYNLGIIYREYAYARKIILLHELTDSIIDTLVNDIKNAIYHTEFSLGKNNYYLGGLLHDWANLYYDFSYKRNKVIKYSAERAKQLAVEKYNESISYNKRFYGNSERVALSFAIMGLLYSEDSLTTALQYYNKAIAELMPSFKNTSLYSLPNKVDTTINTARVLQFIHYKSSALLEQYYKSKNVEYLQQAYLHTKAEIIWFEKMLYNSESNNPSFSLGTYNITPYFTLADILVELYNETKSITYKEEMFAALQLQKNFSLMAASITDKKDFNHNNFMTKTASLSAIQNKLDSKTAIVECFNNNYVWLITKNNAVIVKVNYDGYYKLNNAITENNFQDFKKTSYSLYHSFFKPIEPYLKPIENIVIVPNNVTTTLPIEALVYDTANCNSYKDISKHYLINSYKIQYAFSSTVWYNDTKISSSNNLLCFAPEYDQYASLPFNYNLVEKFSKKYKGNFYLGKQAIKSNFINNANTNNVYHFALHANGKMNDAESARLIFNGNADTAFLTIDDIIDCKMAAPLIVMAACKTSLGKDYGGEGILNFAKAFKMAGNTATINSLWAIDDKATSEVVAMFYNYLDGNNTIANALHKAKKEFIFQSSEPENANPLYWAGIVFYGSDNTIAINTQNVLPSKLWYAIGFILLITITIMFFKYKKKTVI
jgi:CHAT domain-containing protein